MALSVAPLTRVLAWVGKPRLRGGASSPGAPRREPGLRVTVPVWGFVVTLLLVVGSSILSLIEVSRAQRDVVELFRRDERTTYLIGQIAKELARGTFTLRDATSAHPRARSTKVEYARTEVPRIIASVSSASRDLTPLLSDDERASWLTIEPEERRLLENLQASLDAISRGDPVTAERLLDESVIGAAEVYTGLNELSSQNRQRIEGSLQDAERRLELVKLAELVLGVILITGVVGAWSFAIRTIQEQRRELAEYLIDLEAARRDLDAFAGRAAHDLRNAIAPLPLAVASLTRSPGEPQVVRAAAERVQRASLRTTALLDALLAFARAGKPSEGAAAACLDEVVRMSMEGLRPLIERVAAKVDVNVPPGLRLAIAPALLDSVVTNLLSNAVKFLEGRPQREVRIDAHPEGRVVAFRVTDSGPGIAEEALEKLFHPFYRAPGSHAPGTGIGLATVERIVHAYGGDIRVTYKLGQGSRFEVRLPLAL